MKRLQRLALTAMLAAAGTALLAATGEAWRWPLPDWVPPPAVPEDNPMSAAKVALGRHLFYDRRLSRDGSMACASCHEQARAFTDGKAVSKGVTGEFGTRSAMSLANVAYLPVLTWQNPQLKSLEVQSLIPLFGEHPVEMGLAGREQQLFAMLQADPVYGGLFARAFPDEARQGDAALYSLATLTRALASFQRTLLSLGSPYDRYRYGSQPDALSRGRQARRRTVLRREAGVLPLPRRLQLHRQPEARAHCLSPRPASTTPACTTSTDGAPIRRRRPASSSSPASRATPGAFAHRRCATWR